MLAIAPERVAEFAALCARERAPWAQLGTATRRRPARRSATTRRPAAGRFAARARARQAAADDPPRGAGAVAASRRSISRARAVADALDRVLGLPTVADKSFLVTIGDRTVGGLVARDPMIGRFQVPVADCALTTAGFDTYAGEVMSLGERPPVALLDAAAASRLAIGEAITNLAGAPIGAARRGSSCRATGWPPPVIPARTRGSTPACARRARPRSRSASRFPSARTRCRCARSGTARRSSRRSRSSSPRSVPSPTCARAVTPELTRRRRAAAARRSRRRGRAGSAAAASRRCYGQLGDTPPDLDDPARLRAFFATMQTLVAAATASPRITTAPTAARSSARSRWRSPPGIGLELDHDRARRRSVPRAVRRGARRDHRGRTAEHRRRREDVRSPALHGSTRSAARSHGDAHPRRPRAAST